MTVTTPAPSWNTCRVYGRWNLLDGTRRPGKYKVTMPVRVTNVPNDVIIPAGIFAQGNLDTSAEYSLDIQIPANDDPDNSPNGWQPIVDIEWLDGTKGERYIIDTPADGELNLRTVVLVEAIPVPREVLIRGVAGGIAPLDADGDVLNAAGEKVIPGSGGTTTVDGLTDATIVGRAVVKAVDQAAARAAIGAGTSSLEIGVSSTTAKRGDFLPTAEEITNSSIVGRAVLKAADAAAARAAIGAPEAAAVTAALIGKADLVGGVIPTSQLPPIAINDTFTVGSQAAMLSLVAQRGDVAIRTDAESTGGQRAYILSSDSPSTLADWKAMLAPGQVVSVNGSTGVVSVTAASIGAVPTSRTIAGKALTADVTLTKGDVGLDQVSNLSPSALPISNATQNALDAKLAKTARGKPCIYADGPTTVPNRAAWIAANDPGYSGPVEWDVSAYEDHPGPPTAQMQEGDFVTDRPSE